MQAITIGLDLAKHWFQVQGSTLLERSSSSEGCDARKLSSSFVVKTLASSARRPARRRIIGRAS
jgi:hypothetical protein